VSRRGSSTAIRGLSAFLEVRKVSQGLLADRCRDAGFAFQLKYCTRRREIEAKPCLSMLAPEATAAAVAAAATH
jgi:hypothetical protein